MKLAAYVDRLRAIYTAADRELALAPPAKAADLAALAKLCGAKLPAELRAAWRAGNGSGDAPMFARPEILEGFALLSVAAAKRTHASMKKRAPSYAGYSDPKPRDRRIAPGWFHPGWLPFAEAARGALVLLVDFAPSAKGAVGQVIAYTHDPDAMTYVAPSFERFLDASAKWFAAESDELLLSY